MRELHRRGRALLALGAVCAAQVASVAFSSPAAAATTNTLLAGAVLTSGQGVVSTNSNYRLMMQSDGNLVLYSAVRAVWSSRTPGHAGARVTLQSDGNLVVRSTTSAALWSSGTGGSGANRAIVQDDGNVVLYTPANKAVWATGTTSAYGSVDNPSATATLRRGASLSSGASLVSVSGAYRTTMQTDGNVVVRGPAGVTWASKTTNWQGSRLSLNTDGNVVMYAAGGAAVWSTGTQGRGAVELIMGNNGTLALYTAAGAVLWRAPGAATQVVFPPATSPPPTATSRYVRNLTGDATSDASVMNSEGCADGHANEAGHPYVTLLAFGAQQPSVPAGGWGVQLTGTHTQLTNARVVAATQAYIDGYTACMASFSQLTVAVGTNNDSGVGSALDGRGGTVWGRDVIAPLAAYAATKRQVIVAGANDIEPGFTGTQSQATSWTSGYLAATRAPYAFTGSADGCPFAKAGQTGVCSYGWTQTQLYNLAYGAAPARMHPLPQIFTARLAQQWVNISAVGVTAHKAPIAFAGPLTSYAACGSGCSLTNTAAWDAFWLRLQALPKVRISGLPYGPDLRVDG